ncbi:MAG: glycosyl transferase, partial [Lachnospiraceae bacterium]|nr:glycosyl transferase [Lachnospiraceae bacterium]
GGNDDNAPQNQTAYSKVIWKAVMSRLHEDLEPADYDKPDNIVTAAVCKKSGKLAIPGVCDCDPRGNMVYTEYFEKGTEPTETCDHHTIINVCLDSGMPASPNCPPESIASGVYIIGGSANTDDGPCLVSQETLSISCTVHGGGGPYEFTDPVTPVTPPVDPAAVPAEAAPAETPPAEAAPEAVPEAPPAEAAQ